MAVGRPAVRARCPDRRTLLVLVLLLVGYMALFSRQPTDPTVATAPNPEFLALFDLEPAEWPSGGLSAPVDSPCAAAAQLAELTGGQGPRLDGCDCDPVCDEHCECAGRTEEQCVADRTADSRAGPRCAEAEHHGPGQRLVSYSLFQADGGGATTAADNQTDRDGWGWLLQGLKRNAALSILLYRGWRIRVYHDTAPGSARRARLAATACQFDHIDLCFVSPADGDSKGVYRGALWRFLPLSDPLVDTFVSRDLDSRISNREAAAVHQWLASNRTFHIMRDHWDHLITVPGGLWGARPALRRQLADKLGTQLNKWMAHPGHKNWDQRALHSVVWFHAAVDSVQHDSYTCQRFPGYTVPFPTRRRNDTTQYLGQVIRPPEGSGAPAPAEKLLKCPPQCRPREHQDWEYC
ncbi:uncharacterized protein LOC122377647 [Amphibalanus amphitrite]|uniref:uncharacterized protein LOC122377647 n=1 Tax=Amphibalanus amphitrite TaxID=1232801 RepID=UPI001C90FA1A|nr:uncharacterized protein LOC122377647 [Amphibalanus amphitrite]